MLLFFLHFKIGSRDKERRVWSPLTLKEIVKECTCRYQAAITLNLWSCVETDQHSSLCVGWRESYLNKGENNLKYSRVCLILGPSQVRPTHRRVPLSDRTALVQLNPPVGPKPTA